MRARWRNWGCDGLPSGSARRWADADTLAETFAGPPAAQIARGKPSWRPGAAWLVGLSFALWTTCGWSQTGPGYALRFDGTNSFVQGPAAQVFNAFPLTVTAWIRSSMRR